MCLTKSVTGLGKKYWNPEQMFLNDVQSVSLKLEMCKKENEEHVLHYITTFGPFCTILNAVDVQICICIVEINTTKANECLLPHIVVEFCKICGRL